MPRLLCVCKTDIVMLQYNIMPNMPECERIIGSIDHFYGHLEIESVGHLGLTSIEYKTGEKVSLI